MMEQLQIIGRVEKVDFPELNSPAVPARIDTGAKTSTIWASAAVQEDNKLAVVFFGKSSPFYTGMKIIFPSYEVVTVASSNGYVEERYKIRLQVIVKGRRIRASFTLADRSTQVYPVLIGRNVLRGKFMVNVKLGAPLIKLEKRREITKRLQAKKINHDRKVT